MVTRQRTHVAAYTSGVRSSTFEVYRCWLVGPAFQRPREVPRSVREQIYKNAVTHHYFPRSFTFALYSTSTAVRNTLQNGLNAERKWASVIQTAAGFELERRRNHLRLPTNTQGETDRQFLCLGLHLSPRATCSVCQVRPSMVVANIRGQ